MKTDSIKTVIDCITVMGIEKFLDENAEFSYSNIDGVYHYTSKILSVDKFIYFDFGKTKELSLVVQQNSPTLTDIRNDFHIEKSNYDFRDDISNVNLSENVYFMAEGKLDISSSPIKSFDARGNIKYENEIPVSSIVVEHTG